jgi:hypothetical protein
MHMCRKNPTQEVLSVRRGSPRAVEEPRAAEDEAVPAAEVETRPDGGPAANCK